jgi:uncharacterized repeat protein (TIGR01451 family)
LAISTTHTGNFTQGDIGDTYAIIVTNVGNAASSGTVTVVDMLPVGLTATAISGAGWTTNLGTLTCTRSDALAAGATYPAIIITVNVAASAAASVTNTATVSGGGDVSPTNNTAIDPTTINAAATPTVTTGIASAVGTTTATLNGTVDPNGQPAAVQFQFGTNMSYGSVASISGPLTGTTTQAVSANLTGLVAGATYYFRIGATNVLGAANGLDQTFATAAPSAPDLAITAAHTGNFTQGDAGDTYTLIVTNVGTTVSIGGVTVSDTLPAGLAATAISGAGWSTNLGTLTCARSDTLAVGAAYPPITLTVSVAANAAANVTNNATVSGGGDVSPTNNTAADTTVINAATAPTVTTGAATGVGSAAATLNGSVDPNGQTTAVHFDYGLTTGYGSTASVSGNLSGTTTQAVATTITGLAAGTTYHFRVGASNVLGSTNGLDQTFATVPAGAPDLAITATHFGNFNQGDSGDVYTIVVTNVGATASSGTVTVTNFLPAGLTATAISGGGWTTNLGNLTGTRSDALAAGASYSPITVTVTVAANAPASVTFTTAVSGGGDANSANNSFSDITSINPSLGSATNVVISQVYGGGGNASATYQNDFVELFNPLSTAVDLSTWSVQYASAAGNSWSNTKVNLTGSIQPHRYYLVKLASQAAVGAALPTADVTDTNINMSASNGKIALVSSQTALTASDPVGSSGVVDFVGYGTANAFEGSGPAAAISATTSTMRKNGGYTDANDNAADFTISTPPAPRNSASPANPVIVADLTVSKTHAGTFTQGDAGDSYTITVTNVGTAATVGAVSVTDSLPAGFTATGISGIGWTTNLANLTCTRSDALPAGASYPPITVTVNVSAGAPASLTNAATVSGGGDVSPANNTASDATTILPAAAPTAITGTASGVGTNTAILNGVVNPNGQSAAVQFQYGLTSGYGSTAALAGNFSGTTTQAVSANLPGLLPGTAYHFRVAATNVLGTNAGQDQVFTTLAPIEAWRLQWFGMTADIPPAADYYVATSDGMPNLLKYALGLNPLLATNDPVAGDISTGYLRLTAPKNPYATDISFHVEATDALPSAAWTNATTFDVNTATLLQAHADTPVAASAAGFIRLHVTRP